MIGVGLGSHGTDTNHVRSDTDGRRRSENKPLVCGTIKEKLRKSEGGTKVWLFPPVRLCVASLPPAGLECVTRCCL